LNAPVLFIPEDYYEVEDNSVIIIDFGSIKIDSSIIDYDESRNYA
jgi:hypothetical protein